MLGVNEDLAQKIKRLERTVGNQDADLQAILKMLTKLMEPRPIPPRRPIGFVGPARE
jgi:hypothetical protein